jgi:hypothetical protein
LLRSKFLCNLEKFIYLFHTWELLFSNAHLIYKVLQVHNRQTNERDLVICIFEDIVIPLLNFLKIYMLFQLDTCINRYNYQSFPIIEVCLMIFVIVPICKDNFLYLALAWDNDCLFSSSVQRDQVAIQIYIISLGLILASKLLEHIAVID